MDLRHRIGKIECKGEEGTRLIVFDLGNCVVPLAEMVATGEGTYSGKMQQLLFF